MDRYLCRKSLHNFVRLAWHVIEPSTPLNDAWYVGCICEHLEAVTRGEIKRLVANMPPRSTKSKIFSVMWFCWTWLSQPGSHWLYASYDEALARRDSVACRDLIKSPFYRDLISRNWHLFDDNDPEWVVKADQDQADYFGNTMFGTRMATTPKGRGTGFNANYLVADDIHDVKDAGHPQRLQIAKDWWNYRMTTRGNQPADLRKVVVGQVVDENDLSNQLKDMGYEHLALPLEYEPTRVFFDREASKAAGERYPIHLTSLQLRNPATRDPRTKEGESLDPVRFTPEVIAEWKQSLQHHAPAQLQQRASPREGAIFFQEMFRSFRISYRDQRQVFVLRCGDQPDRVYAVADCRFFQCVDTASTIKQRSDFTAVGTFAITPEADLLVYHVWKDKLEVTWQALALRCFREGPHLWDPVTRKFTKLGEWPRTLLFQAVENKSSGIGLIQLGAATGNPLTPLKADQDVIERAGPVAGYYAAGKVYHMEGGIWVQDLQQGLLQFPSGRHDDDIMTVFHAGILLTHDKILRAYLDGQLLTNSLTPDEDRYVIDPAVHTVEHYQADGPIDVIHEDMDGKPIEVSGWWNRP